MDLTDLAHYHLLLNHFPTIGTIFGLGLLLLALIRKSDELKQISMVVFVLIAMIALPTYVTGNAAQDRIAGTTTASLELIEAHQSNALLAFIFMELLGLVCWLGLWQYRRSSSYSRWMMPAVLVLGLITFGLMANAANIGGEIGHDEIRMAGTESARIEMLRGSVLSTFITNKTWIWPAAETLHFMGMGLLFGIVIAIDLRVLGVMPNVSYKALHQLLPWAVLGYTVNTITGMLFFVGAYQQYIGNPVFYWKLVLLLVSAVNALYLTLFDDTWVLEAGQEAPMRVKWIAGSAVVLWIGVMYCGRMLPFIGNAF